MPNESPFRRDEAVPRAFVLSVGDELLSGETVDTNKAMLAAGLTGLGFEVVAAETVADRPEEIAGAVRRAADRAEVCVVTGGLGPTTDDLTALSVARALGVSLVRDEVAVQQIEDRFRERGRVMPVANLKQADLPAGSSRLDNPIGTAPGFAVGVPRRGPDGPKTLGDCWMCSLPGVPREAKRMWEGEVVPRLRARFPGLGATPRRRYRLVGLGESQVAERVEPIVEAARAASSGLAGLMIHYRARTPEVEVVLEALPSATGERATLAELRAFDASLDAALAPALYGIGSADLPTRVVDVVASRHLTLGVAESCTGGQVSALVTGVPGASSCLRGAVVAYDNEVKAQLLGVPRELLAREGAVSEACARAMAEGVRALLGCDLAVATTGIAGPTGATADKPVGLVHLAVASPSGTVHRELRLVGDRALISHSAALVALKLVWDELVRAGHATVFDAGEPA